IPTGSSSRCSGRCPTAARRPPASWTSKARWPVAVSVPDRAAAIMEPSGAGSLDAGAACSIIHDSPEATMAQNAPSSSPTAPQTPRGINHVVLNVRDIEVSHRFWTEVMGFRCVAQLKSVPGRVRPKMRFYSGIDAHGDLTHHDLALAEVPSAGEGEGGRETW